MNEWNDYLKELYEIQKRNELSPEGLEMVEIVKKLSIPWDLDINKCLENFDIVTNYSFLDYRVPNYGTTSINKVLTEKYLGLLSPHYSTCFIACFPDVYTWAHDADNNLECLELLETFIKDKDLYITKDTKLNSQAYLLLCNLYIKQMSVFETK
ncbi:hypothetical protein [Ferruginibacter sp. SUN106]|uniref:hypothetical protein n=1 Tax=Ferruginibacter sp. SUN106 TaxID=2978348 RepID=UPI003D369713